MNTQNRIASAVVALSIIIAVAGCATTTQTGAAIGGIGGALFGGSIGSTIVGAAAGAGIGYLTEQEKQNALQAQADEQRALRESSITDDPDTAYAPSNDNPFVGSTWRVISVEGYEELSEASQALVSFPTNSKVTTLVSRKDGSSDAYVESYGIVDDVLVFSGVEDGESYTVTARFAINNNLMTLTAGDAHLVLQEVEEAGD